jgi:hypothetical protein
MDSQGNKTTTLHVCDVQSATICDTQNLLPQTKADIRRAKQAEWQRQCRLQKELEKQAEWQGQCRLQKELGKQAECQRQYRLRKELKKKTK